MKFIRGLAVILCYMISIKGQLTQDNSVVKEKRSTDHYKAGDDSCVCSERETPNKPGEVLSDENLSLQEENKKLQEQNEDLMLTCGPAEKGESTDIWQAAKDGNLPAVRFYYNQDPTNINKKNENEWSNTPLVYAASWGHLDIVKYFLNRGVDIDEGNIHKNTPLMHAANMGYLSVLNYLLDKGAKINLRNIDNGSALHWGVWGNRLDAVKILIRRGANKNFKTKDGRTALAEAKFKGRTSIVNYLSTL